MKLKEVLEEARKKKPSFLWFFVRVMDEHGGIEKAFPCPILPDERQIIIWKDGKKSILERSKYMITYNTGEQEERVSYRLSGYSCPFFVEDMDYMYGYYYYCHARGKGCVDPKLAEGEYWKCKYARKAGKRRHKRPSTGGVVWLPDGGGSKEGGRFDG